jgi:redox-sensing transcriptional repressor
MAQRISETDILGIWNFTSQDLDGFDDELIVENVHLGDSLMTLNYRIANESNNLK